VGPDRPVFSKADLDVQSRDESSIQFHLHVTFFPKLFTNLLVIFGCVHCSAEILGYGCKMNTVLDIHQYLEIEDDPARFSSWMFCYSMVNWSCMILNQSKSLRAHDVSQTRKNRKKSDFSNQPDNRGKSWAWSIDHGLDHGPTSISHILNLIDRSQIS
jgi:hypothetical protein